MNYKLWLTLIPICILFINCKKEVYSPPLFEYNCSDTSYYYDNENVLEKKIVQYFQNQLFIRSEDLDGNIIYYNYDNKNRLIKSGSITNGENYFVEYIYGSNDTIVEERYSDLQTYFYEYNGDRKKIKTTYYDNNVLIYEEFYTYEYYNNVEIMKLSRENGTKYYYFKVVNESNIPVSFDTIPYYSIRYYRDNLLDSLVAFQPNEKQWKCFYKYDPKRRLVYSQEAFINYNYLTLNIYECEYTLTDKILRTLIKSYQEYYDTNYYSERKFQYDGNDNLYRINRFSNPNILSEYFLISREGSYMIFRNYLSNNIFIGYSKYSPFCSGNYVPFLKESTYENQPKNFKIFYQNKPNEFAF